MKALVMSDLQWVEYEEWMKFIRIDQNCFDVIFVLGDINQILLGQIAQVFNRKKIIGVLGDFGFPGDLEYYDMTDCHGIKVVIDDRSIAGVEGSNRYKAGPYPMHTQEEIEIVCRELPKVDILLCHNSPSGFHDRENHPVYQGFRGIREYVYRCQPQYLFHGHHHVNSIDHYENTTLIGVFGAIIFNLESGEIEIVLQQEPVGTHG
jgi:predicted phosphodiesterase